jgi:hypothetical protein
MIWKGIAYFCFNYKIFLKFWVTVTHFYNYLITGEVEIRRIMVQNQLGQKKICETSSQQKKTGHGGAFLSSQ